MTRKDPLVDLLIHDLTGPLAVISTSTNSLLSREEKYGPYNDSQKETLKRILRNAEKAKSLLQEMVEAYRSEEGCFRKERFLIEDVLGDALRDAIELVRPDIEEELSGIDNQKGFVNLLQKHGINIEVSGKYGKVLFSHDRTKIRQIIRNLISNALKYRQKTMKLSITGDTDLIISVEDDGVGIPKEKQDHIFRRFSDLYDKEGGPEGLGFGLSCVKNLLEAMSGEILLKSAEGTGSCFTIRIPPI